MAFRGPRPNATLITAEVAIDWVRSHQYLGVWVNRHLTLQTQVNYLKSRITARTNILKAITSYASGASHRIKRTFYTHAIRSLDDYSAPCVISATPEYISQLEVLQNQSLRLILSAPRWTKVVNLRAEAQLTALSDRITQLITTLIAKMAAIQSPPPSHSYTGP